MIAAIILSGLALLAATVCLVMTVRNEKRSQKRNAALIEYVDHWAKVLVGQGKEQESRTAAYTDALGEKIDVRLKKLEEGIIPDYEQAKAAADAVNDFSKGITNILGFDPVEALKTDRRKKELGDVK